MREGGLFSKGWSPLYNANVEETEGEITETQQEVQLSEPAPQATVATPKVTAPAAIKTPAKIAAPVGIPKTTVTPTTVKTSPTASVTSKPGVNSATASKANDVLARFNIGTKG